MRAVTTGIVLAVAAALLAGCGGGGPKALRTRAGGPVTLVLLVDPGVRANTAPERARLLTPVAEFMASDLINRLKRAGYEVSLVDSKDSFAPADGTYLLYVAITAYTPGNRAAQVLVGGAAGTATLGLRYDLFETVIAPFAGDDFATNGGPGPRLGPGSAYGDWRNCAIDADNAVVRLIRRDLEARLGPL